MARNADLWLRVGMELEVGWKPPILDVRMFGAASVEAVGAGETTLLRTILGLLLCLAERLSTPFGHRPPGYVAQAKSIDPLFPISVREIVAMGFYPALGWWRRPDGRQRRELDALLAGFGTGPVGPTPAALPSAREDGARGAPWAGLGGRLGSGGGSGAAWPCPADDGGRGAGHPVGRGGAAMPGVMPLFQAFPQAVVAGLLTAVACALLGVFVILKRVVFIGVALSELAVLGIVAGYTVGVSPFWGGDLCERGRGAVAGPSVRAGTVAGGCLARDVVCGVGWSGGLGWRWFDPSRAGAFVLRRSSHQCDDRGLCQRGLRVGGHAPPLAATARAAV